MKRTTIFLDEETKDLLALASFVLDKPVSKIIREAVNKEFKKEKLNEMLQRKIG